MTSSNGNIFRVTGPLCGEFTGDRRSPHTKASDAELWFFFYDLRVNKRLSKQSWGWWFETTSSSLWRHCNVRDQFPHFWCVQCISWAIWIEMCFPVRPRVRLYITVDYCHLNRTNISMKLGCNISSVVTCNHRQRKQNDGVSIVTSHCPQSCIFA